MNNAHSCHHHSRWPECHPYAYRKYQLYRRRDAMHDIGNLCIGTVLWLVCLVLVPAVVMWAAS